MCNFMLNLNILELKFNFNGRENAIYPVVIKDGNELILIDTGFPGQIELFKNVAESIGINLNELTKIVITHHDIDHIGSLAEMKRTFKNAKILSSKIEADYINGNKESIRLEMLRKNFDNLPEERKEFALRLQKLSENLERISVDTEITEDCFLPNCNKIKIINTPGHLPGHISVYFEETKTLITGDAIGLADGKLYINPQNTIDMPLAKLSIKKLLDYDITNIVCYHGGVFEGNCKEELEGLI